MNKELSIRQLLKKGTVLLFQLWNKRTVPSVSLEEGKRTGPTLFGSF
ncbi:hypothetical protein LCM20_09495 [Halobacillus litoralis]|nr:hypothetical protein [Halobacillus litoralis]MCA0970823.1 hypothetical protein [Halobacillus litoralis]